MEPGQHTNPLEEALSHGSRRVAEVASLTGATAQVVLQRRALHNARKAAGHEAATRILDEQERLIHQQARLSWAPAHDPQWLAKTDLPQAGRAWASAAGYADVDPAAASAMRKCEDRLRVLHPYAMAQYDRRRADGMSPLDAMHKTTPFFGHSPDARVGDPAPAHPALAGSTAGAWQDASPAADYAPGSPAESEPAPDSAPPTELRGRQIIARLQSGARAAGRPELGADELAMVLEATTNLPGDMIDKLARQAAAEGRARSDERRAANAERALDGAIDLATTASADERTIGLTGAQRGAGVADSARAHAGADRSAAQLAALSFPRSAADAVRTAATARTSRPARAPARNRTPENAKRPGQSP